MRHKTIDPVGQTYGCWTVLGEVSRGNNNDRRFLCRCKCGQEKILYLNSFYYRQHSRCGVCRMVNPVGQTFGHWIVLRELDRNGPRRMFWCQCDKCGREKALPMGNLVYGHSTQCQSCNAKELWAQGKIHGARPARVKSHNKSLTIKEWARELGVNENTIRSRIKRGQKIDQPAGRWFVHSGVGKNMSQWAQVFGISRERVRQLIDLEGKTIGELVRRYGIQL